MRCGMWMGLLLVVAFSAPLAAHDQGDWVDLFDGVSLDGWTQRGGKARYSVEADCIVGTTVPDTPNSFLCTDREYGDFLLEFEFKVDPELNSGVQIRSHSLPEYQNGRVHGYQVEIDASDRAWTAGIYDESRRGWLNDLTTNDRARYAFKQNQWNRVRVRAVGDSIRTWLNGVPAADLTDSMTASGFIALQVHGVGGRQDPLQVRWRHLRLRQLSSASSGDTDKDHAESTGEESTPLVDAGAEVRKLAGGFQFCEGPALGPDGRLYFSNIPGETILALSAGGEVETFRPDSGRANGLMWTPNDALIACEGGRRRITRQRPDQPVEVLADQYDGHPLNSPNDLVLDGAGGIYFTDPRYGDRSDMQLDTEGVYYINRGGKLSLAAGDVKRPNGLALTRDNRKLYIGDTGAPAIWVYDVAGPGKLTNKRQFADIGSDGMSLDDQGNIYATWRGQVHVLSPAGDVLMQIDIPENPTNVTFAGVGNRELIITAGRSVYGLQMNVSGGRAYANPD